LTFLPDTGDDPKFLREALFCFMVNVGYLNSEINTPELNYSFLVHTSGKKADHSVDYKQIVKIFEALKDEKIQTTRYIIKESGKLPNPAIQVMKIILRNMF
jgi:hypothetical protein